MALEGKLKIDGKEPGYEVVECEYEFTQPIDSNGKPCANPRGGLIHFTILSPDENDALFHEWMFSKSEMKQGVFEFTITSGAESKRKIVVFQGAHCIHLYECFSRHSNDQMYTKITLSAETISFGKRGTVYSNNELSIGLTS